MANQLQNPANSSKTLRLFEQNKPILVRSAVIGGAILTLGSITPFLWGALSSVSIIGAIGALGVVYIGVIRSLPLLGQKWENALLKNRKIEARENPMEQLHNRYIERKRKLDQTKNALALIGKNVTSMERRLDDRRQVDADHDLTKSKKQLAAARAFYDVNITRYQEAKGKLEEFRTAIDRWGFEYQFALDGRDVMTGLAGVHGDDPEQEVLTEEAVRSIESQYDQVFATMELDAILAQADRIASARGGDIVDAEFSVPEKIN